MEASHKKHWQHLKVGKDAEEEEYMRVTFRIQESVYAELLMSSAERVFQVRVTVVV